MKSCISIAASFLLAALFLTGCSGGGFAPATVSSGNLAGSAGGTNAPPLIVNGAISVNGFIDRVNRTEVGADTDYLLVLMQFSGLSGSFPEGLSVRIVEETTITREGEVRDPMALQIGQQVLIRLEGQDEREFNTNGQVKAVEIRILSP